MAGGDGGEECSEQDLGKGRKEAQWRSEDQGAWSTEGGLGAARGDRAEDWAGGRARLREKRRLYPRAKDVSRIRATSTLCWALCQTVEGPAVGQGLLLGLALDSAGWEVMGDLLSAPHGRHWPSPQPLGWPVLSAAGPSWRRPWPCLASMAHVGSCSPG